MSLIISEPTLSSSSTCIFKNHRHFVPIGEKIYYFAGFKELPPTEPPDLDGGLSPPCDDPKLVVMVTGLAPDTCEVDLNNLPGPGDPGAPIPPDEIEPTHGQQPGNLARQDFCSGTFQ